MMASNQETLMYAAIMMVQTAESASQIPLDVAEEVGVVLDEKLDEFILGDAPTEAVVLARMEARVAKAFIAFRRDLEQPMRDLGEARRDFLTYLQTHHDELQAAMAQKVQATLEEEANNDGE